MEAVSGPLNVLRWVKNGAGGTVNPSIEREEGRGGECNVIRVSMALFPVSKERYVGVSRVDWWTRVILACIGLFSTLWLVT
jgi:hypothetical protein